MCYLSVLAMVTVTKVLQQNIPNSGTMFFNVTFALLLAGITVPWVTDLLNTGTMCVVSHMDNNCDKGTRIR